jgi:hypothetical protein
MHGAVPKDRDRGSGPVVFRKSEDGVGDMRRCRYGVDSNNQVDFPVTRRLLGLLDVLARVPAGEDPELADDELLDRLSATCRATSRHRQGRAGG